MGPQALGRGVAMATFRPTVCAWLRAGRMPQAAQADHRLSRERPR